MIYFDNAATTPVTAAVRQAVAAALDGCLGNPSSPHAQGIAAEREIAEAGRFLAGILGCRPEEILYTSGGTESNNLALIGATRRYKRRGGHILSTPTEHPSVRQPLLHLKEEGFDVTFAPTEEWATCLKDETLLVSFSQVNHETGDLNDVVALARQVKQRNPQIIVHVDGSQGFCKEWCSFAQVDLYTFSAHKIHGITGTGGLMAQREVRLMPMLYGGGQQNDIRPGTENVLGIVSMHAAAREAWQERENNRPYIDAIRSILAGLADELPAVFINHRPGSVTPYILNMSFIGVKGETLVHMLSQKDIYISMGAACRSRKNERSPLYALGLDAARVESAVRFSFSPMNTQDEALAVKKAVAECVVTLRGRTR